MSQDIYLPRPATMVAKSQMTPHEMYFQFRLDSGEPLGHRPGQFAQVSVPGIGEAPISISNSPTRLDGAFEMVVRKMGNVTNALHALEPGAKIGVRGPFGTSFPVDGELKGKDLLYVCGGIGLVPVRSAIQYTLDRREDYGRIIILSGTKTCAERLYCDEVSGWCACEGGAEVLETVDKADDPDWKGDVGVVTTLFSKISIDAANTYALLCGPPVMYKFVILSLTEMNVPYERIFVSLERHMKCGVGKCGHCQINGIYACQDGPVFRFSEVAQVKEAI
jgi:NAD(P)H-flavin reductase